MRKKYAEQVAPPSSVPVVPRSLEARALESES